MTRRLKNIEKINEDLFLSHLGELVSESHKNTNSRETIIKTTCMGFSRVIEILNLIVYEIGWDGNCFMLMFEYKDVCINYHCDVVEGEFELINYKL